MKGCFRILAAMLAAMMLVGPGCCFAESVPDEAAPAGFSAGNAIRSADAGRKMLILPNALIEVEEEAFFGVAAEHVFLPDQLTEIQDRAFDGLLSLASVYIPDSVRSIGQDAFGRLVEALVLGTAGSYADDWAAEHHFSFAGTRIRHIALRAGREAERLPRPQGKDAGLLEERDETVRPVRREAASGTLEIRTARRGERAEMNHLVGLFP